MAALIASPINTSHRMSCILMEKLKKKKKTLKRFFVLCLVSVCLYDAFEKIPKGGKKTCFSSPPKKVNQTKKDKSKTEGLESAVCVVGTPAF